MDALGVAVGGGIHAAVHCSMWLVGDNVLGVHVLAPNIPVGATPLLLGWRPAQERVQQRRAAVKSIFICRWSNCRDRRRIPRRHRRRGRGRQPLQVHVTPELAALTVLAWPFHTLDCPLKCDLQLLVSFRAEEVVALCASHVVVVAAPLSFQVRPLRVEVHQAIGAVEVLGLAAGVFMEAAPLFLG